MLKILIGRCTVPEVSKVLDFTATGGVNNAGLGLKVLIFDARKSTLKRQNLYIWYNCHKKGILMGIVLDMIGQGGDKLGAKKVKNGPKDKKLGEEAKEITPGADQTMDKEGEFAVRKSKSERFRMSMRRQPQHKGKPSMGGPRVRKAR